MNSESKSYTKIIIQTKLTKQLRLLHQKFYHQLVRKVFLMKIKLLKQRLRLQKVTSMICHQHLASLETVFSEVQALYMLRQIFSKDPQTTCMVANENLIS